MADILDFLRFLQQRREQAVAPITQEISQFGFPQAAEKFGDPRVIGALRAAGMNIPMNQPEGLTGQGEYDIPKQQIPAGTGGKIPVYPTPTMAQQENQFIQNLSPENRQILMERKTGLRASAATEENIRVREEASKDLSAHRDKIYELQDKVMDLRTTHNKELLQLSRDKLDAQSQAQADKIQAQIDSINQKHTYQIELQKNLFQHQIDLLQLRLEGTSPDKLATITGKVRDDSRSMAMNSLAAQGYGSIGLVNGMPQMIWKDTTKGPELFDREYEKYYNKMVEEHKAIGVNIPKIGVKEAEQKARVERATKKVLKGPLEKGASLTPQDKGKVIKMISDLKKQGATSDSIISQMAEAGIDPDNFMEYLK
jgi:hypothetical protein